MVRRNAIYYDAAEPVQKYTEVVVVEPEEAFDLKADFPLYRVKKFLYTTLTEGDFVEDKGDYIVVDEATTERLHPYLSISVDGVFFSEFELLPNETAFEEFLASKPVKPNHLVSIIIRIKNETEEVAIFRNVEIGFEVEMEEARPVLDKISLFKGVEYFNRDSLQWTQNVLEKVVKPGIVPKFLERSDNEEWEDEDYFTFWEQFIYIPALWAVYIKYFKNLINDRNMLREFLRQRTLTALFESEDVLYYLMTNYHNEMRRRGTNLVFSAKYDLPEDTYKGDITVRGEFLRLLNLTDMSSIELYRFEEFETEWLLDETSPNYQSPTSSKIAIKAYGTENYDLGDLEHDYFATNINRVETTVRMSATANREPYDITTIGFTTPSNGEGTLGLTEQIDHTEDVSSEDLKKLITVNPNLHYEIVLTYYSKNYESTIDFGVYAFDSFGLYIMQPLKINEVWTQSNLFVADYRYVPAANEGNIPHVLRGIIFSYDKGILSHTDYQLGPNMTIGQGSHLRFGNYQTTRICPYVKLKPFGDPNSLVILDLKVRLLSIPLATYLGKDAYVYLTGVQGSGFYDRDVAFSFTDKYLMPYSSEIIKDF